MIDTLPDTVALPKRTLLQEKDYIKLKIDRHREGEKLRVLDLFSGCGGLSLGFHKAEYEIVAAVEIDDNAMSSHAKNFHVGSSKIKEHTIGRDIQKTNPEDLFRKLGLQGNTFSQIDIIIGGPPCQAFTRVGRAKLRNINSDSNAFLNDPRSQLYKRYLEYVRRLKPLALLMENVPDILNYGGVNIADLVCEDLEKQGYRCRYTLLNTVFYGIPQMRERMFLIAIHENLGLVAMMLSVTGLFTLVSLNIMKRMKEIGVRKVLGASVPSIAGIMNREFIVILLIASAFGSWASFSLTNSLMGSIWKYYQGVNTLTFLISIGLLITVSLATIGYKVFAVATMNPVDTLRDE